MSVIETHETAPTRFIEANGIRYAYRRFGKESGVPLVFLQHFRGTMDNWDPMITNGFAQDRPVVLFDNAGVGLSGGETPDNVADMARHAVAFIEALGLTQVDLLGFSLGGFVAQQVTLGHPDLVRRVVLAGTGPQGGEGMDRFTPAVEAVATKEKSGPESLLFLFFEPTATSQAAGRAFLQRLGARTTDREEPSSLQTRDAQLKAIQAWGVPEGERYARLKQIRQPVLVANGANDIMVPTVNSFILSQRLPNASLILYPDSGHGFLFQYAELFVEHVSRFLRS
jgi:pimeloyl-ACP methyl ester carboxylesterase